MTAVSTALLVALVVSMIANIALVSRLRAAKSSALFYVRKRSRGGRMKLFRWMDK